MAAAPSPDQIGFDFGSEFVAPEVPRKPASQTTTRSRSAATPAPRTPSSAFAAQPEVSAASATTGLNPATPTLTPSAEYPLEHSVQALEQSGQYRVLRRLPVVNAYPDCAPGDATIRVAVVDTETTGLDPQRDRIIELSMLVVNIHLTTGRPCGEVLRYGGLEDPQRPIPAEVVKLTGIDDSMVAGHRIDDASLERALQTVDVVVAHNAAFDRKFMELRWPFFANVAWGCSVQDIPWKALGHGSVKLEFLAYEMGWFYDAHRAEIDCRAVLSLLSQPLSLNPDASTSQASGQTGWQLLWQSVQQPTLRVQANGSPFESKDALRQAGYRWDAEDRVWYRLLSESLMAQEAIWLQDVVYKGRDATLAIETVNATLRYSNRRGPIDYQPLSRWTEA